MSIQPCIRICMFYNGVFKEEGCATVPEARGYRLRGCQPFHQQAFDIDKQTGRNRNGIWQRCIDRDRLFKSSARSSLSKFLGNGSIPVDGHLRTNCDSSPCSMNVHCTLIYHWLKAQASSRRKLATVPILISRLY